MFNNFIKIVIEPKVTFPSITSSSSTNSSIDIDISTEYQQNQWRGNQKYLYIIAYNLKYEWEALDIFNKKLPHEYVEPQKTETLKNSNSKKTTNEKSFKKAGVNANSHLTNSSISVGGKNMTSGMLKDKGKIEYSDLYSYQGNFSYWIKIYKHPIKFEYELENIAGKSIPCNETLVNSYIDQDVSQHLRIHDLHAEVEYHIRIKPCNELGCNKRIDERSKIVKITKPYGPSASPNNVKLIRRAPFGLIASWEDIAYINRNGRIMGYHLVLTIESLNEIRSVNVSEKTFAFKAIGKYIYACLKVAGFNRYPAMSPYTQEVCQYTDEAGKWVPSGHTTSFQHRVSTGLL